MRTLLEYALANVVAASLLAVAVLLIGLVVRRPAITNALWILVLVRLLVPPVWTVPLPFLASREETTESTPIVAVPEDVASVEAGDEIAWEPADDDALAQVTAPVAPAISSEEAGPEVSTDLPVAEMPAVAALDVKSYVVPTLFVCWCAGSAFVLLRSLRRIAAFRRALRDGVPAEPSIQAQANAIALQMGLRSCPPVLIVPGRVWPSLWMPGLRTSQSKLLLPAGLLPLLEGEQRAAVLAHELAHLRRGDPWVRWLELICCGVYWWYPLLGWFRRQLRESEEQCCDMWVVAALSGRRTYATALVETAVFLDGTPSPALASGAGPVRNLQRRVTMIMRATWPARLTRTGLAVVLSLGGLGLAFGPALAQPERDEKDKDRPIPRVRDKDRPAKEREQPDRPGREREGDRERPREAGGNEIREAREALEKARNQVREAMEKVRAAEARISRLEGRPIPPQIDGARDPFVRPDRDRIPDDRRPKAGGPKDRIPERPRGDRDPAVRGPGDERRPDRLPGDRESPRRDADAPVGNASQLRALQQQIEELRKALEEMRTEMRRGPGRGPGSFPGSGLGGPGGFPGGPGRPGGSGPGRPGSPGKDALPAKRPPAEKDLER